MKFTSLIQVAFLLLIIVGGHIYWAKRHLRRWAKQNGYTITKCKFNFTNLGPFSYFATSSGQYVFKIEAVNRQGEYRQGYARVGGYIFGLLRSRVEVKWNKHSL